MRIITSIWNAARIRNKNIRKLENGTEKFENFALFQKAPQNAPRYFDGLSYYANGIFELGKDRVPLGQPVDQSIFPSRIKVRVLKDTVIPPQSEAFVACGLPIQNAPRDLVLISQSNTLTDSDLLVAPAVFSSTSARILVTNPTNEPKILYANTTAASAAPVSSQEDPAVILHYS
ncbi:hypothetical protein L5515_006539 [Caenorhabditis briggsae]|uniref:Uncharacterized protein n=1 Tax=Caenorhabditis briggsae TaxID=6238 RepID=A0AAE9F0X8_CAEBR|nr:hypothetical protein L5515_006539 [Caenorhabditis briggsae]